MKTKHLSILLLAALALGAMNACGDAGEAQPQNTESVQKETEAVTETETEETLQSLLPDNLDFGGRDIRTLYCYYQERDGFMLKSDEENGDIVNDAIYKRNLSVSSDLNVTFSYEDVCSMVNSGDGAKLLKKSVTAGSDDYDLVIGVQYNIVPEVVNNLLLNLDGCDYLHLDQPWWYGDYINEMTVGTGKTYFVTGDITLGVLRNMSCMYVNKNLYKQYFESVDDLYREVIDGKWTFDRMAESCMGLYRDLNGDGKYDDEDQYGLGTIAVNLTDHFTYDAGIRATTRDEDNIPMLTMNNEKTVNFTQRLYSLYYENEGVRVFPGDYNSLDVLMPNKFNNDTLLYLPGWFYTSELLRGMDVDYAVIPFPKYDESQETYLSLAHDISTVVCVPTTCSCVNDVTAVMEALAFEGYRDVLPAYYEVAIKVKYTRDSTNEAMQILDMIHDNATTDFAFIYNYALGGIGLIERDLMGGKKNDFASLYEKKEAGVLKKLETLLGVYTDLE